MRTCITFPNNVNGIFSTSEHNGSGYIVHQIIFNIHKGVGSTSPEAIAHTHSTQRHHLFSKEYVDEKSLLGLAKFT